MSPGALIDRMDRARRAQHAALVEELEAVAAFDERRLWRAHGATSMTAWLATHRAICGAGFR